MRPAGRLLVAAVLLVVLAGSSLANDLDELLGDDFNASEYPRPGHLSPEEDWKFELPPHVRRRGISHAGSMMGMRRLVKRCIQKEPIKFGVVGGSISTGHGMPDTSHGPEYKGSYSRLAFDWLNSACPHPDNAYLNGALAATGSMHFSQCLWQSVPKDLDVILVEFAVNEGGNPSCDASMELIVRRLLLHNPAITVIIVNWHDHWPQDEHDQPAQNWEPHVKGHAEEGFTQIGMWYDTVVISARTAFLPEMLAGTPGFNLLDFSYNWNHPNEKGHRWLAELIGSHTSRIMPRHHPSPCRPLATQVSAMRDEISRRHALGPPPPPLMHPFVAGNDVEAATEAGCVFGPPLEGHARVHAGWDFKQSKHWGWETEGGGGNVRSPPTGGHDCMIDRRSLLFESVPDKDLLIDIGEVHEHVMLTYLVSGKRELGTAAVQCEGGCTCGGFQLEAKSPHPITVRFQKRIKMVAAKDCQLRLRVKGGYFQVLGFVKWPPGTRSLDGALGETFPYEYRARENMHKLMANVTW